MVCVSAGSKSRLAKAAGGGTCSKRYFLKLRCRKIVRRCSEKHNCNSKCKKLRVPDHFWKFRCGKFHAAVVKSTFASQIVKNKHEGSGHFLKFSCRKNCASWHVQNLHAAVARSMQFKMHKTHHVRATFSKTLTN